MFIVYVVLFQSTIWLNCFPPVHWIPKHTNKSFKLCPALEQQPQKQINTAIQPRKKRGRNMFPRARQIKEKGGGGILKYLILNIKMLWKVRFL